jgi:hypothetical protein
VQYASHQYRRLLTLNGLIGIMSKKVAAGVTMKHAIVHSKNTELYNYVVQQPQTSFLSGLAKSQ